MIDQFHFLRPAWLLALIPLIWFLWQGLGRRYSSRSWQSVVDAELLPHLLSGRESIKDNRLWILSAVCGLLAIIALAGPVWEKLPQPIFNQQSALVIVLDLSRSMDVGDIKPSRLVRARHKITDILSLRKEGQTALVNYAADAFVVTPLTEDVGTISALLPSLETGLMPAQGSRADKALLQAFALFENAAVPKGDVLLVSDGFSQHEFDAMQQLLKANHGHRISVLGVGTAEGGPIPLTSGGFLKDEQGSIVIPRLDDKNMRGIADIGGGSFQMITSNDADINAILNTMRSRLLEGEVEASDFSADIWREQGPWLLLILIPLVALVFRRGVILVLPLLLLPVSPGAEAIGWDELWQNTNQRGSRAFEQGEHQSAAELFENPEWKASSLYRAEDFEQALQYWEGNDSDDAHYNRGNALAKLERLEEAIEAYDQALQRNAGHEDAAFNKKQVEEQLKQQQQQQQDQQQSEQNQKEQNQQNDSQQSSGDNGGDQQKESSDQQTQQQPTNPEESDDGELDQAKQDQPAESEQASSQTEAQQSLDKQMSDQATEQWLRKIPDDPGGLLRRKFLYQYRQRGDNSKAQEPW